MTQAKEDLEQGLSDEEVRRRTIDRARKDTLAGIRILLPSMTRKAIRAPAPLAIRILADHFAKKWRKKKVRDAAARIVDALGWDAWLADYILNWAKTGEPGPYFAGFEGGVVSAAIGPEGDRFPIVVAVVTPVTDLGRLVEELRAVHQRTMPRASSRSIRNAEVQARWFRLFHEDYSDRQIAEMELEAIGFRFRAKDDAEYKRELRLMTGRVKTGRHRWKKQVTEITDPV
jgi:hypothetical protein